MKFGTGSPLIIVVFGLLLFSMSGFGQDYEVDPTFAPSFNQRINAIAIAPDQKILVGGDFYEPGWSLVRLNTDGTLDTSFNAPVGPESEVTSVQILPDGKILIAGVFQYVGQNVRILRLNPDGSLDPTLTTPPVIPLGSQYNPLTKAMAQPDGKIIACGYFLQANGQQRKGLARFNSDGTLDTTFTTTLTRTDGYEPNCFDIEIYPSGQFLIMGGFLHVNGVQTYGKARINADGTLDTAFQFGGIAEGFSDLILTSNGSILAPTYGTIYGQGGNPDTNLTGLKQFGPQGGQSPAAVVNCNSFTAVNPVFPTGFQQNDGKILISGCKSPWNNFQYNFGRFYSNGSFDQTMDRIDISTFSGSNAPIKQIERQADGKYLIAGEFATVNGLPRVRMVRLRPRTAPNYSPDFDFDGDRKADLAVFRPSNRYWYVRLSAGGYIFQPWGYATDKLVAGDYDNDGKADIAIYRDGQWHILKSADGSYELRTFGTASDSPFVGHLSGDDSIDDKVDMVIRRPLSVGGSNVSWTIKDFHQPFTGGGSVTGENLSDKPIVADLDGDSIDEFGYFRDGLWRTIARGGTTGGNGYPNSIRTTNFGLAGDIPIPADYDGDGQADYAVFRPSNGMWYIAGSTAGFIILPFGLDGDIPVPADYDGDGKTDVAVFRPSNGVWYQYLSNGGVFHVEQWGTSGDKPIHAQALQ